MIIKIIFYNDLEFHIIMIMEHAFSIQILEQPSELTEHEMQSFVGMM